VKNQADLARKLGISRARVTQILRLLKLDSLIIQELEKLGDPLKARIITERMLRPYVNKSFREQKELLSILEHFLDYRERKIFQNTYYLFVPSYLFWIGQ